MTATLKFPHPSRCLRTTEFLDADAPIINWCLEYLDIRDRSPQVKAVEIFEFVRDELDFRFGIATEPHEYVASNIIDGGTGFCTQRAIVLCALARAAGIPSVLLFADLLDRSLSPALVSTLGTQIIHEHGLAALYLGERWLKVDVGPSPEHVIRNAYRCVEFDGMSDALMSATKLTGSPHATYLNFHGAYDDLPFETMMAGWAESYPHLSHEQLSDIQSVTGGSSACN